MRIPLLYLITKKIFLFLPIFFLVLSCKTNSSSFEDAICKEIIIVKDSEHEKQKEQFLGSIKNITIIPLQLDSTILFSGFPQTYVTSEYIYFFDSNQKELSVFSSGGEYLFKIAAHGQGPEEYIQPTNISISSDGKILIFDKARATILLYNDSGKFIGSKKIEYPADKAVFLNDSTYLTFNKTFSLFDHNKDVLHVVNKNGKVKKTFLSLPERIQKSTIEPASGNFFSGINEVKLILPWCNHIFEITPDSANCKYSIDFESHNIPESFYETNKDMEKDFPKLFEEISSRGWARSINYYQETNNHVFFQYLKKNDIWYVLYDKLNKEAYTAEFKSLPSEWQLIAKPFLSCYCGRFYNLVSVSHMNLLLNIDCFDNELIKNLRCQYEFYKKNRGKYIENEDMIFLSFEMKDIMNK